MNLTKNAVLSDLVPSEFYLGQNYPNPFSEKTTIKFCVAYKSKVKLEVFNSEGEMIKILLDEEKEAGTYEVEFAAESGSASGKDACNLLGGMYFYKLKAGDYSNEKKMMISK